MSLTVVGGAPDPTPRGRLDEDANRLFDFAVDRPDGFTRPEAEFEFNWSAAYFRIVERRLRQIMGTESENLVCNPDPDNPGGPWLYWMTNDPDRTAIWYANRLDDAETRLSTMCSIAQSAMRAYDARTTIGKRARALFRNSNRALEDLAEIRQAV